MITLHHLAYSRSFRVLWLLEELGLDYELVSYDRTADFRAPPELSNVHPLGKAPIIVDGDLMLAESSAILRYLEHRYGSGKFTPASSTSRAMQDEWLDFVESTAAMPVMLTVLGKRTGGLSEKMDAFTRPEVAKVIGYVSGGVSPGPFLMGEQLTLADIQMTYILEICSSAGLLEAFPLVAAYLERLRSQPGFKRALEKGGPISQSPK